VVFVSLLGIGSFHYEMLCCKSGFYFFILGMGMGRRGPLSAGMERDENGCCGDGNDVETSCGDMDGNGYESCGDGRGWIQKLQIAIPMQLSTVHVSYFTVVVVLVVVS